MPSIEVCELPQGTLLGRYLRTGAYADCYVAEVAMPVSHAEYVEAFYTTALFKVERLLLAWFVSKQSTDAQARQLASGRLDSFAAWRVESRDVDQLLMCDITGRTRSWLMVATTTAHGRPGTRLYFGSAVVPVRDRKTGRTSLGPVFRALLGFHKIYSVVLLRAARSRLIAQRANQ